MRCVFKDTATIYTKCGATYNRAVLRDTFWSGGVKARYKDTGAQPLHNATLYVKLCGDGAWHTPQAMDCAYEIWKRRYNISPPFERMGSIYIPAADYAKLPQHRGFWTVDIDGSFIYPYEVEFEFDAGQDLLFQRDRQLRWMYPDYKQPVAVEENMHGSPDMWHVVIRM